MDLHGLFMSIGGGTVFDTFNFLVNIKNCVTECNDKGQNLIALKSVANFFEYNSAVFRYYCSILVSLQPWSCHTPSQEDKKIYRGLHWNWWKFFNLSAEFWHNCKAGGGISVAAWKHCGNPCPNYTYPTNGGTTRLKGNSWRQQLASTLSQKRQFCRNSHVAINRQTKSRSRFEQSEPHCKSGNRSWFVTSEL